MKVFFSSKQNVSNNDSFSPSASKPAQAVDSWRKLGIPFSIGKVIPVSREMLYQVHEQEYVDEVLDLERSNGFGNTNPEVAKALPWVCGSMVQAALHSLKTGETSFSPTSGAHHAHYSSGYGFCTFNHLVLAALEAKKKGAIRVGIIDLDAHPSDGILDIKEKLNLDFLEVYSFGYCPIARSNPEKWLNETLRLKCFEFEGYDLVIYNAGADPHEDDELGGYLSTEQMAERDEIVFSILSYLKVPVAVSLAGGYQRDESGSIRPVLDLHDNTFRKAFNTESTNETRNTTYRKRESINQNEGE
jgi:acetoin utilization deacetylase AcuC-like enzyme